MNGNGSCATNQGVASGYLRVIDDEMAGISMEDLQNFETTQSLLYVLFLNKYGSVSGFIKEMLKEAKIIQESLRIIKRDSEKK
jgi:hypothetical protein